MERHCVNSTAADQYAQRLGHQDDLELAIERLEMMWYTEFEQCIHQSENPQLMEFLERYADQISAMFREMAGDQIKQTNHEI
ncbi:hypothetical protein [Endozoicomonas sp.]|uniref:hypothetical protein n=1 Tax=Endozoicomonas sp. TaxID=1892382 RepID=UPI003AF61794